MEIELASFGRAALFLGVPFVLLVFFLQWKWAKTCVENIQVLVAQRGGGGRYYLASKVGGEVTIHDPNTDETRTWPVNELATIDVLYPGLGFLPAWMQKTIRMAIVNEGDWEPMLNRSPHRKQVASPDVVLFLKAIAEQHPAAAEQIGDFIKGISTGPTREMIADPATLGNLQRSGVLKALATVSNDLMDILRNLSSRLSRIVGPDPRIVYIGLGLVAVLSGILVYYGVQTSSATSEIADQLDSIRGALGVQ